MTYSLTKIKTFRGMEGQGLNATICRDGKPIAFVMDDASGGPVQIDFRNPGQSGASFKATTSEAAAREEREFGAFAMKWYFDSGAAAKHDDEMVAMGVKKEDLTVPTPADAMESWINTLVDAEQERKQLDRAARTKTLFRIKGEAYQAGEYRTVKEPYGPRVQAFLDKKYPGQVTEIYGVKVPA